MNNIPENYLDALKWIVTLFQKNNISYILTGGFAAKLYGSPRELRDIDFDVPDESLETIAKYAYEKIILGPQLHTSRAFKNNILKLNYHNINIDIGGGTDCLIFDEKNNEWVRDPVDFNKFKELIVDNVKVNVITPEDLVRYKSRYPRSEDLIDLSAVKDYK